MKHKEEQEASARQPGTFGGVSTPSVLTTLGTILFLRLGFVTGGTVPICEAPES